MSFHKRYLTKEVILSNLQNIDNLLKSDSLIMDDWSSKFISDLDKEERELRNKIKEDQKLLSGCPDKHKDYSKLKSLSETLIGLNINPTWMDIHFTQDKLGRLQLDFEEMGVLEKVKEKAIKLIIEYYESK
jgi:hypothetical protein